MSGKTLQKMASKTGSTIEITIITRMCPPYFWVKFTIFMQKIAHNDPNFKKNLTKFKDDYFSIETKNIHLLKNK